MPTMSKTKNGKTLSTAISGDLEHSKSSGRAEPVLARHGIEVQKYGKIVRLPNGLDEKVCTRVAGLLNQILVDTMTLRDLYKKHHWQVSGPTFYQLHLLFDKHYTEQADLVDQIAERIQLLGGISIAMAADVAEETHIPRPPRGREDVPTQISRLLNAHEILIAEVRDAADVCDDAGDQGSNDLLISGVLRSNELQVWFLAEHLIDLPLVEAAESDSGESNESDEKPVGAKTLAAH